MSILESLELPVSNEAAGIILVALIAFWRELFGLLRFLFSKRERNAEAVMQEATAVEKLMQQNIETQRQSMATQQQLMTTTATFTEFVLDTRKRGDEREAQHSEQVKALEKSLIDSQHELEDTNEKVRTLSEMVQKLAIENEGKDRTIDTLNRRVTMLEESEKQAHHLVIQKDYKITELENRLKELEPLENRVKELEAEIRRLKAIQHQQAQPPVEALVIAMGATADPLKTQPEPGTIQETPEPSEKGVSADADA